MKWTDEAENAIKRVPFFVRKRVKNRVEKEAIDAGKKIVTLGAVKATQARYLSNMASEIKGYQIEVCFGPNGCSNRAMPGDSLVEKLTALLEGADLLSFLKERVKGSLKFHHEFRIAVAECPNACSQPQIKDIGIIGACRPMLVKDSCNHCGQCVDVCSENALALDTTGPSLQFAERECLCCARCIGECSTGALSAGDRGYRVQLGGKLGRRPRLATELSGVYTEAETVAIVSHCINFYKQNSAHGERFADLLPPAAFHILQKHVDTQLRRGAPV